MKRITICIISILMLFAQTMHAQELSADEYSNAKVEIKFYDRTMYYPGNGESNPVYVHITISNGSTDDLRFKLADDRMFSLDFNAYTIKNNLLQNTDSLIKKRTTNQTVYFREISLGPGEEYSFIENIKDYLIIAEPSIYYLEMQFYPEMIKNKNIAIRSNRLVLEITPSPAAAASNTIAVKEKTAEILKPQEISPDKVVEQTITARQKTLWDQYFLYIDVEEMLQRDAAQKRIYRSVSANERARMLDAYKSSLMQNHIDNDIVAIPERFEIEKTTYSHTEGSVSVIEWFKYKTYREKKRYIYYVRQTDGIWKIYDYNVDNLGTE